jgi:hypothetical protein
MSNQKYTLVFQPFNINDLKKEFQSILSNYTDKYPKITKMSELTQYQERFTEMEDYLQEWGKKNKDGTPHPIDVELGTIGNIDKLANIGRSLHLFNSQLCSLKLEQSIPKLDDKKIHKLNNNIYNLKNKIKEQKQFEKKLLNELLKYLTNDYHRSPLTYSVSLAKTDKGDDAITDQVYIFNTNDNCIDDFGSCKTDNNVIFITIKNLISNSFIKDKIILKYIQSSTDKNLKKNEQCIFLIKKSDYKKIKKELYDSHIVHNLHTPFFSIKLNFDTKEQKYCPIVKSHYCYNFDEVNYDTSNARVKTDFIDDIDDTIFMALGRHMNADDDLPYVGTISHKKDEYNYGAYNYTGHFPLDDIKDKNLLDKKVMIRIIDDDIYIQQITEKNVLIL